VKADCFFNFNIEPVLARASWPPSHCMLVARQATKTRLAALRRARKKPTEANSHKSLESPAFSGFCPLAPKRHGFVTLGSVSG
jgi:hypothetical protein